MNELLLRQLIREILGVKREREALPHGFYEPGVGEIWRVTGDMFKYIFERDLHDKTDQRSRDVIKQTLQSQKGFSSVDPTRKKNELPNTPKKGFQLTSELFPEDIVFAPALIKKHWDASDDEIRKGEIPDPNYSSPTNAYRALKYNKPEFVQPSETELPKVIFIPTEDARENAVKYGARLLNMMIPFQRIRGINIDYVITPQSAAPLAKMFGDEVANMLNATHMQGGIKKTRDGSRVFWDPIAIHGTEALGRGPGPNPIDPDLLEQVKNHIIAELEAGTYQAHRIAPAGLKKFIRGTMEIDYDAPIKLSRRLTQQLSDLGLSANPDSPLTFKDLREILKMLDSAKNENEQAKQESCIIVDDTVDTLNTFINCRKEAREAGFLVHGMFAMFKRA